MKKNTFSIFLILFSILCNTSYAQDSTSKASWISKHPIEFSMGSHAISLPFNPSLFGLFYPEINIGFQSNFLDRKNININIVNGIGFASHLFQGEKYFADSYLRLKYKFPLKIYTQVGLGVALNLLTYPSPVYSLNSNGVYKEKNQVKTAVYSGFNLEVGYRLKCAKQLELDLFSKYNAGANLFQHPDISLFPYNSFQLGLRFYIQQNN